MVDDLLSFFAERLKVLLRDKGARHDLVDAVFALLFFFFFFFFFFRARMIS